MIPFIFPEKTVFVKQRTTHDCVPACMAMLTGLPIDAVIERLGDCFNPEKGTRNDHLSLNRMGFCDDEFIHIYKDWRLSVQLFKRFAWRRRALLTVPSLNHEGGWHMVYVDGENLYDPSTQKTYENYSQLEPHYMTLFRE